MTNFIKGDIVEPTAEFRERLQESIESQPDLAGEGDRRVIAGETLRVIGDTVTPIFGINFVLAAPMGTEIENLYAEDFEQDPFNPKYDGLVLLLEDEIQHVNGVLAGV